MHSRQARRVFGGIIVIAVLAIGTLVATQWATHTLRKQVVALLGPTGHAAHIDVSLRQIILDDVTIGGPPGWPAPQTLRARRITLSLAPLALLQHQVVIRDATFDTPYLSIVRGSDKRITLLPNLRAKHDVNGAPPNTLTTGGAEAAGAAAPSPASSPGMAPTTSVADQASSVRTAQPSVGSSTGSGTSRSYPVRLDNVTIRDGTLDFYDRRVSPDARIDTLAGEGDHAAPYRLTFDRLQAQIGPMQFPSGDAKTVFTISANARDADSPSSAGSAPATASFSAAGSPSTTANNEKATNGSSPVHMDGWIVLSTQQSDIRTHFENVDVRTLTPYLDPHGTIAFEHGRAALSAHSTVENRQLQANGTLSLAQLQVARGHGPTSVLETLPREAVISALQDEKGRISLNFTLSGNLSDPSFSLDETLSTRIIAGLAKALGVNAEGVARSVGDTTKGLGDALRGLLGK
ncbi:DUF748 domain-containing protein [Robbsia andropogonis]|uniref:DUF748 domain-containing protein n=1 Tax=Robbsia andropogonis TaxID=28092 RepID=UPI0004639860|nr:DUF748 domain-containing protein [Robbsia andropogonis]MCP1121143.1 DUF748 domain-containing protein [Robbsia andropogonis]MCP1130936.1 DUF748 domain-containing protein [Robbsia andropogonis]